MNNFHLNKFDLFTQFIQTDKSRSMSIILHPVFHVSKRHITGTNEEKTGKSAKKTRIKYY